MSAFWDKSKKKKEKREEKKPQSSAVKKAEADAKKSVKKSKEKSAKKENKKKKKNIVPKEHASFIERILVSPKISEAVMRQQEMNKYTFIVYSSASKKEIAEAVSVMYSVKVAGVNVLNYKSKKRFFRGVAGKTKSYKKAIVTLKKGDAIDLFGEIK